MISLTHMQHRANGGTVVVQHRPHFTTCELRPCKPLDLTKLLPHTIYLDRGPPTLERPSSDAAIMADEPPPAKRAKL